MREDGCVWTDPTPRQASYKWFCIGKPDSQNPGMIRLDNGQRLPVGTHLLEHGASLRLNDGTKVAEIPLTARFRKAALDYLDGLMRHDPDPAICDGRIDPIPAGLDAGLASVVANDDFGGGAAVLGMQLYREITCNPGTQSAADILGMIGKFGGRGPLRAKPKGDDRFAEPSGKPRPSGGSSGAAEHTQPPALPGRTTPLSPAARAHIFYGETYKGKSTGWHHEASADRSKGTYVIEETRSSTDAHSVYEANVVIEGVKKGPRSTFFPKHWTQEQVEQAITEASRHARPDSRQPWILTGTTPEGLEIEFHSKNGAIQSAYPVYKGRR